MFTHKRIKIVSGVFVLLFLLFFWTGDAQGKLSFQPLFIPDGEMELIDLDMDGLNDIVIYTYTSVLVFWHHEGEGFHKQYDYKVDSNWASEYRQDFSLTDVNEDGLVDIFHVKEGCIEVFFQKPNKVFSASADTVLEFPEKVWFVDLGNVSRNKGLEVVTLSPDGVLAYELSENLEYHLPVVKTKESMFLARIESNIYSRKWPCPWNFCMDANGDGLDDLFLPQMTTVALMVQDAEGKFEKAFNLKVPIIVEFSPGSDYSNSMRPLIEKRSTSLWTGLQVPSISCQDVNKDGRTDIVMERAYVFKQNDDGSFPENPTIQVVPEPEMQKERPHMEEISDEYCDVNGDGITDRVYQYRPWSTGAMKSDVKIYFGGGKRDIYTLDPEKDLPDCLKSGGNFLFEAPMVDLDGDGALDILMYDTKYRITEVKNWVDIQRGDIEGEINITFFNKKQNYFSTLPEYRKKQKVNYAIKAYQIFESKIFDYIRSMISVNYDFTGDGKKDLLVRVASNEKGDTLYVYKNTGNKSEIFAERPTIVLETPNFHHFMIMDVNSDGINDFILIDGNGRRSGILMSYQKFGL